MMDKSLTPGLLTGVLALFCGATASILSPSHRVSAALAGSSVGAVSGTILKRRKEYESQEEVLQKIKHILNGEFNSSISLISKEIQSFKDESGELKQSISLLSEEIQSLKGDLEGLKIQFKSSNLASSEPITNKFALLNSSEEIEEIFEKNIAHDVPISAEFINIISCLNARNIRVDRYYQPVSKDDVFDKIAFTIGEKYTTLAPLYQQIIRSLNSKSKVGFSLAKSNPDEIATCTQFCQTLLQNSLLADYYYDKQQKLISATPQIGNPEINCFLNGRWFELYVYIKVTDFLTANKLEYECLMNPHITLRNGDSFEIDLLFLVNNELIWIECKSGHQSSSSLSSYCARRKLLDVAKNRAFIVGLKLSEPQTVSWTNLWDITVANCNNLLKHISTAVGLSDNLLDNLSEITKIQETHKSSANNSFQLSQFLKKKRILPLPKCRANIINELIKMFSELEHPTSMTQLKVNLGQSLGISNSQVTSILNVIMRSQCVLDANGTPVSTYQEPAFALISSEYDVLERKCVECYVSTVLGVNTNYFDNAGNVREFEKIVGGKLPDIDIIERLKDEM
jgi:hypothetical protein